MAKALEFSEHVTAQNTRNELDLVGTTLDRAFEHWIAVRSAASRTVLKDAAMKWAKQIELVLGTRTASCYVNALLLVLDCQERAQYIAGSLRSKREVSLGDRQFLHRLWAEERAALRGYEDVEASTYAALARQRESDGTS